MSGDTDVFPAIRTAKRLRPEVHICIAAPHRRFNQELGRVADRCFKVGKEQYAKHQLPDPVTAADGRVIAKPAEW